MTLPDAKRLYAVTEATWAPARARRIGPWTIREGRGGGQRVSATTADGAITAANIEVAERAMADLGQSAIFMIRAGDEGLDAILKHRGYAIKDPVLQFAAPLPELVQTVAPRLSAFAIWPPLSIMAELWAAGGIGPERLAVMDRVSGPKSAILARQTGRAAGCAFVALDDRVAMVHAVEVAPAQRRKGAGANMMRLAAHWAAGQGARHLAVVVTAQNDAATAFYSAMGMTRIGRYHYRIRNPV